MHMLFFHNRVVVRRSIVVLCLATFGWPPAVVAAPIVLVTDGLSEVELMNSRRMPSQHHCHCGYWSTIDNGRTGRHHDRRPAAVTEPYPSAATIEHDGTNHHHHDCRPAAVTEPNPAAANTWIGHQHDRRPAAVTEPYPSATAIYKGGTGHQHDRRPAAVTESYLSATVVDNDEADHYRDRHPTAVNEPHPAAANTLAGHHHDRTTVKCSMPDVCPIHHEHQTPVTDETVTADVLASVHYYEAEEDTNDDEEYPIYSFVPIILITLFFLVYPILYFASNRRKQKDTFTLQTNNCGCTAKYIRCLK